MSTGRCFVGSVLTLYLISISLSSAQFCDKDGCSTLEKKGHLKPFGEHRQAEGEIRSLKYAPSSADFYNKFIFGRQPVVVRNAASDWPAVKNWSNESYLNEKFGSEVFSVEFRKRFKNEFPVKKPMTLREFLKIYKEDNVYLDSPFTTSTMLNDILLPSFINCDKISSNIDSVNLLMSSGGTSSAFHHDGYENVLAMVSGSKTVVLVNSSYSRSLYADEPSIHPGVLPFDPEKLDLETYSGLADVPYYEITVNEGDLLYIPQYWFHHVRSNGSPNIGINIWFGQFNFEDHFAKAGLSEDTNVVEVTAMFDELVKDEPKNIHCKGQTLSLGEVLKINSSDPKTGHLRIPAQNQRPADITLASGYTMPVFGFGTATLMDNTLPAVKAALEAGYRMIDTAQGYPMSEHSIAEAIAQSGVPRSEIFIITKLHPRFLGYDTTIEAVEMSLKDLNTDYIDLFLIHSQQCDDFLLACGEGEPKGTWRESWEAMEEMHRRGKLRSVGVSNFGVADLQELVELATVPVSAVENFFDPFHQEKKVRAFCWKHNIRFIGYSTLGTQWVYFHGLTKNPVLSSPLILELASHYEFVPSQVVLRWAIHLNVTVIPRSKNPRNIQLNLRALDLSLKPEEIEMLTNITLYEYHPLERKYIKNEECHDSHDQCLAWAEAGECRKNPDWMLVNCQLSCKMCYDEPVESVDGAINPEVFVGSEDHYMYAFGKNGALSWRFKTYDKIQGSAALKADGEVLFFGSSDGFVYALARLTGKLVWTFPTKGAVTATPQVSLMGAVYIGSHDYHFYAIDVRNGSLVWKKDLQCAVWGGAVIDERTKVLYTGCVADKAKPTKDVPRVLALRLETGDKIWQFETAGNVYSSPALSEDGRTVFIASLDGHVYALDSESGEQLWAYDTGSEIESSPAVSKLDGTLYMGLLKDKLVALNTLKGPLMGTLKWEVDMGGEVVSSPVITDDGKLFIWSGDGRILAVNQTDGTIIWAPVTNDYVVSSVAVSRSNVVYGASTDKTVFALNGEDGSIIWTYDTGAAVVATPVLVPEDRMPVG